MHQDILKTLITEQEIANRVKELGKQISKDYANCEDLLVISVLKGSILFVADLIREIDVHTEIDFMVVSSFEGGVKSTGVVKIVKDLDIPIDKKDLLIVEDILDSGKTLSYLREILNGRNPKSLKICTLLDKPVRREADVYADYIGFTVPDEFVVGYGLDYEERYRNVPYIGILKPSVYTAQDAKDLGL